MFGFLKKKTEKEEVEPQYIVVTLNARVQPIDRGDIYEDPLDEVLEKEAIGGVSGGGSLLSELGEIECCDTEIQVNNSDEKTVNLIKLTLEKLGAPKGSKMRVEATGAEIEFGKLEGLAIYLNGTDLDDEVYENSDLNYVYDELNRLTDGIGKVFSYWQGPTETAIYVYGTSFSEMKLKISELVDNYPLCQKCRIEQIA